MPTPPGWRHSAESKAKISAGLKRYNLQQRLEQPIEERITEVDKEKTCTKCGETKFISAFYAKKKTLKCGLVHVYPEACCKACKRAENSAYYENLKAEGRYEALYHKREQNRDKDKQREYQREWAAAKRRQLGMKSNGGGWRKFREEGFGGLLPTDPIAKFLEEEMKRAKHGLTTLAKEAHMNERRLRSVLKREYATVSLAVTDEILTGLGQPWLLHELYPLEDNLPTFGYFKP